MANFNDTTDTDYSIVSDDIVYDVIGLNFKFFMCYSVICYPLLQCQLKLGQRITKYQKIMKRI